MMVQNQLKKQSQMLPDYLLRVAGASMNLSRGNPADLVQQNRTPQVAEMTRLIEAIAQNLLSACEPDNLLWGTEDLTPLKSKSKQLSAPGKDDDQDNDDDNETDATHSSHPYQHRRSDYLRRLLRFMSPISMHVACQVCHVISHGRHGSKVSGLEAQSAFLLFSHWLPVAPHLTLMATEFLRSLNDPWDQSILRNSRYTFLFAEAAYKLCSFFVGRGEVETIKGLWDWTFLFGILDASDIEMENTEATHMLSTFMPKALHWYAARALTALMDWKPQVAQSVLERLNIDNEQVPWEQHEWAKEDEESELQDARFRGLSTLWGSEDFPVPSTDEIATLLPLSNYLAHVGNGIFFYKAGALTIAANGNTENRTKTENKERSLIPTTTTCENLALLGAALCQEPYPPPIMLCGPQGSGKSSVLREILRICRPGDALLEFHIDDETDSKTLIGSYSTTDVPGEFAWRPGALTHASREGRWVLFEDIDTVPVEIQATIIKLLEDRLLPLGNGKYEKAHPDFRIFGTCTTTKSGHENKFSRRFGARTGAGRRILSPSLWRKVHVEPLPFSELRDVAIALYPDIPTSIIEVALALMKTLDKSGRTAMDENTSDLNTADQTAAVMDSRSLSLYSGGRSPSVRDFFKLLSRISNGICFERNVTYVTESQRMICLTESVEILVGSCPDVDMRHDFVTRIAAPAWGVSAQLARAYIDSRCPSTRLASDYVEIGRVQINLGRHSDFVRRQSGTFAQTNYALRIMESIGVCVRQNEPVLLVGETGCGKTTMVQQLASICDRELIVQNLSLQTDSTDLLGGFKPLELKNVARKVYLDFVDLFCSSFSRKQNAKFLEFAASALEKESWKKLSQCFQKAAKLGLSQMKERIRTDEGTPSRKNRDLVASWKRFKDSSIKFERQIISCDAGLAFVFAEGALVDAIQHGKWVLLDEINLASSDTLQRLCGLLDDPSGSVTLTERGDASEIPRHPNFRLFAAMNPATDAGKKDLPESIRARFSELYVNELLDPVELRSVTARYLDSVLPVDGKPPEHKDVVISVVEVYLKCRQMADTVLSDGAGHKPRYTLRTLSRALSAAKSMVLEQRIALARALYEGFQLAFEGALDVASVEAIKKALKVLLPAEIKKSDLEHPGRRPGGSAGSAHVLIKPFWIKTGPKELVDWSEASSNGKSRFILTPSVSTSLRRLARALASGPWPILLEGPTSAGKTTLVEYIAARSGYHVVRINNHEHTDVQEYTGSFAADQNGSLTFRDGLLVQALRRGHWVILDELNLAPTEVLEALNRLLDDNRELYLAETNEVVKPHPDFRLFATQNPSSGAYGGRKPLSRAFRNRFVEIHMGDIPSAEMTTILEKRCGCPPSTATKLVEVMVALRYQRSKCNLFMGKDSFITPRDLLRWAERKSSSRLQFAEQGYMLLAERLRSFEEKEMVKSVLEEYLKVKLNPSEMYYGETSEALRVLRDALRNPELVKDTVVASIAPTRSLLRLITLVMTCIEQKEPVLLVGETGCGKTTVVQFLSLLQKKTLFAINCHATTETSDLLGGLRPVRGRDVIRQEIYDKLRSLLSSWSPQAALNQLCIPPSLLSGNVTDEGTSMVTDEGTSMVEDQEASGSTGQESAIPDVETMLSIARAVATFHAQREATGEAASGGCRTNKRRKLSASCASSDEETTSTAGDDVSLEKILEDIEALARRYTSLFEWSDGPLVTAMKDGQMLLLDEMSLAEDAVLERLNSVLEPSRTLVLAEKGDDGSPVDTRVIVAHDGFRVFATMNPGGDFGKRELSPALRSRFTEIWVPAVTEMEDFELVLSRTLEMSHSQVSSPLVERMLNYVDWFNNKICSDPASPCANYSLSLRDVLSWAHFIREACEANSQLGLWEAYLHGASLMHLDGLGLGAGLALEDADAVRTKCELFIRSQIFNETYGGNSEKGHFFVVTPSRTFGAAPFFIPLGPIEVPISNFNMTAPTTATNAFRVLRAMQIKKPVLLEGSPGVGKTSLITALAAASGNNLVRINLSEQTDIADLMGSDLPVQNENRSGASFEWSDGVLLRAIKDGSWVLLDELNLASQSVLEGLNSCLDHRAAVYIPELGKTFHCPSTFRVFGAQNPLAQGGGRKGLPKSFLNRFTKVYVDALTDLDLRTIVRARYPSFNGDGINKMIDFNNAVQEQVVERREFGSEGAPWEFNLRDVFRWCELVSQASTIHSSARDIYLQRFRNEEDRGKVDVLFRSHFGLSMRSSAPPLFRLTSSSVQIGETILPRMDPLAGVHTIPKQMQPQLFLGRLLQMEALARCVVLQWPCLVIGPSSSGKTSAIAALAEVCNTSLVEQCLSPSSDVTELLGCFEQVETNDYELKVAREACNIVDEYFCIQALNAQSSKEIWNLVAELKMYLMGNNESMNSASIFKKVARLCSLVKTKEYPTDEGSADFAKRLERLEAEVHNETTKARETARSHFVWRDGILVEAMINGYWVVLNNVNLCPSSVLDRLNSVMEIGGELLLSECGTLDSNGSMTHRIIKPHPNFRIFLTMDASNGEVSRAMRNRCVELYFQAPLGCKKTGNESASLCKEDRVDLMSVVHSNGARSFEVASTAMLWHIQELEMSSINGAEAPCPRIVASSVAMLSSLLSRGVSGHQSLIAFLRVGYELESLSVSHRLGKMPGQILSGHQSETLQSGSPIRQLWTKPAVMAHVQWEARVLRLLDFNLSRFSENQDLNSLLHVDDCMPIWKERFKVLGLPAKGAVSERLLKLFLLNSNPSDFMARSNFFRGYVSDFTSSLLWMVNYLEKDIDFFKTVMHGDQSSAECSSAGCSSEADLKYYFHYKTLSISRERVDNALLETKWLQGVTARVESVDLSSRLSVLEASVLADEGMLDRSMLACPVTNIASSFFNKFDGLMRELFLESIHLGPTEDVELRKAASLLVAERDRLWQVLQETPLVTHSASFLSFDETEFLVQWKWFKRSLMLLTMGTPDDFRHLTHALKQNLRPFISRVDNAIYGTLGDSWSSRAVGKKMMRPSVPRQVSDWKTLFDLVGLAAECSLSSQMQLSPLDTITGIIDLPMLLDDHHPVLFLGNDFRRQVLAALATLHSYWTDEITLPGDVPSDGISKLGVNSRLRTVMQNKRNEFKLQLSLAKVDTTISTVENQFTAENLEELKDSSLASVTSSEAYATLNSNLLSSFSRIQVSPFREYQCLIEERSIIGEICHILAVDIHKDATSIIRKMIARLKNFIRSCLDCAPWRGSDLRPYQTLVWIVENENGDLGDFIMILRALLLPLLESMSFHSWFNLFNQVGLVSRQLEVPNLWIDDENLNPISVRGQNNHDICFGAVRLQQFVRTELLLHGFTAQLALQKQNRGTRFYTLENYQDRLLQFHAINKVISSDQAQYPKAELWILLCLAKDVFKALRDGLDCDKLDKLVELVSNPGLLADKTLMREVEGIPSSFSDRLLDETFVTLILPLLGFFRDAWAAPSAALEYRRCLSLASISLGLLRSRIAAPHSPLDPGRAPTAKISLIDRRLDHLRREVLAQRLYSGFSTGNFTPTTPVIEEMLEEGARLVTKRSSQERKVVTRPDDAAPFHELFRLSRDFSERVSSSSAVLELVGLILRNDDPSVIGRRLENWLRTSAAFLARLESEFAGYDDVTSAFKHSIRMIQDGLLSLAKFPMESYEPAKTTEQNLFGDLLQYPMPTFDQTIDLGVALLPTLELGTGHPAATSDLHFALTSATISRMLLKKMTVGLGPTDLKKCISVLRCLTNSNAPQSTQEKKNEATSLEAILEQKYQEQFPDHRREFNELFEEKDDDMSETGNEEDDDEISNQENSISFSDNELEWLGLVLEELFRADVSPLSDSTRMMVFHYGYSAALSIEKQYGCTRMLHQCRAEPMSGHVLAMAMSSSLMTPKTRVFGHLYKDSNIIDFQNQPNPAEAILAKLPLQRLMARSTQLLTAFPGHSILLGIGRVCDKVCKFDIMTTPIGKFMTGMEVILRQAQEWEQHASDRVRLGSPLQDVGKLVASWRKLELQSWPQLIASRKLRYEKKARRHLMRLTSILISASAQLEEGSSHVPEAHAVAKWVWKGVVAEGQVMTIPLQNTESDDLTALIKILDTFVLTAPLGEFKERLEILKICADQQESAHSDAITATPWTLHQSRLLRSVHAYYSQFEEMLTSKLDSLIVPLQKKLEGEVKLAKWDDQTYYALAESTERNHRKLMKVLAELDECLDLSTGQLIQQEKVKGIRADVDSNTEVSTTIPPESAIFPAVRKGEDMAASVEMCQGIAVSCNHSWSNVRDLDLSVVQGPNHIQRIQKYAKKMETHLLTLHKAEMNWAQFGVECSSDLCNAVFDRIGALRTKSTRPMKERALTDLFRELKRQGFTSTKWSVPEQLRSIQELFQLPQPCRATDPVDSVTIAELSKAEKYYQRSVAELTEYRAESMLLGSKHLTKRQIDMMLTFGESGLFMITQQRCLLALLMKDTSQLRKGIESLTFDSTELPVQQSKESTRINHVEVAFLLAVESMHQLLLLVKSSPHLLPEASEREWARDTVTKLDGCIAILENQRKIDASSPLVTHTMLQHLLRKVEAAQEVCAIVKKCRDSGRSLGCLPLDCFDVAIDHLNQVRFCDMSAVKVQLASLESVVSSATMAIEKSLIGFQSFVKAVPNADTTSESLSLWECHKELITTWSSSELKKVSQSMAKLAQDLKSVHEVEEDLSKAARERLVGLACDVRVLAEYVLRNANCLLENTASFHACSCKLIYVLLRIFRVLLSKGFCSDETTEDDASDSGGGVDGMTFKDDQDGTGMGEGDGKLDVTDQLESEDQLSGLKSDKQEDNHERESRQLNEEEANQGMEMEADFDGEMCDVPDKPQDDEAEDNDGEEELDRELGDDVNPDEQVVDERMWNDSDDENELNKEEEKFEKDSGVEGDAIEGAMRTKEDDEDGNGDQPDHNEQKDSSDPPESKEDQQDTGEEMSGDINEENEDQYEEGHGVDVKGDDREQEDDPGIDQDMQLDDDMDLNADDDPVEMEDCENEEPDKDEENPDEADDTKELNFGSDTEKEEGNDDITDEINETAAPSGSADHAESEEPPEQSQEEEPKDEERTSNMQKQEPSEVQAHGVRASDGTEGILDAEGENDDEADDDDAGRGDTSGAQGAAQSQSDSQGGNGGTSEKGGAVDCAQEEAQHEDGRDEIPNPFKNPGDASKFWHKKLNIVKNDFSVDEEVDKPQENDRPSTETEPAGAFEYTSQEDENPMQVLGEAPEEEAVELSKPDESEDEKQKGDDPPESNKSKNSDDGGKSSSRKKRPQEALTEDHPKGDDNESNGHTEDQGDNNSDDNTEEENADDDLSNTSDADAEHESGNRVVSDLSRLTVGGQEDVVELDAHMIEDELVTGISSSEAAASRRHWLQIQGQTHSLSRRLCEKLRLVMEPLVASKLRGDYRTGKRINMKRVIGYIASGYRRDKIWLRRTKPAKRDYRVLLAVDDSESMKKSGAGEMALHALATLAMGMNQLEIGELGIASFGEDMKLLHPFHLPFGSESGSDMVMNFKFDQKRTRTSLCVESAIVALEAMGGSSSMQLVFLVSDGRIERDSRDKLKRLIREMMERNILLAMIIVEGEHKKKDSILNMKEVTFEKGKPVVKRFIEDYPFPYYIVLDDMTALPEILGDALRQWFEMLTHLPGPR